MTKKRKTYNSEALMRYARYLGFGELHTCIDKETGLHAIIAIHSTLRGPAIGGCRFRDYDTTGDAIKDVLRLGYMMTLKAAVSRLPHGGAKSVIIKPKNMSNIDRKKLFRRFGEFVNELNGRYITSLDVGTTTDDMDAIAEATPYVIGATGKHPYDADPSPHTAEGVFRGIQAACQHQLGTQDLSGIHVAVQGAGHVAYGLIQRLATAGAKITACDIRPEAISRCVNEFGIQEVAPDDIYDVDCDIFAPCALGGVINLSTIDRLNSRIIAGSANNQLAHHKYAQVLHDRGILYTPDFVINAGGLMSASSSYLHHNTEKADLQVDELYGTLLELFARSSDKNQPTTLVAEMIAHENLVKKNLTETEEHEHCC
jgi:leucine dehydrogenase